MQLGGVVVAAGMCAVVLIRSHAVVTVVAALCFVAAVAGEVGGWYGCSRHSGSFTAAGDI
jgi:hypothetical protein